VIEKQYDSISDENIVRILDFLIGLIDKQDVLCHSIEEALGDMC